MVVTLASIEMVLERLFAAIKSGLPSKLKSVTPIHACLAKEIALAAKGEQGSFAVARKEEVERVAQSAR